MAQRRKLFANLPHNTRLDAPKLKLKRELDSIKGMKLEFTFKNAKYRYIHSYKRGKDLK